MAGVNPPKGLGFLRVVVARDAAYYLLGKRALGGQVAAREFVAAMGLPESATLLVKRIKGDRCSAMQASASESQAQSTAYAPIGVDSDSGESPGPKPLTTGDIAFCFAGLRWDTEEKWKDALGKQRDWIEACVAVPAGGRGKGVAPKLWNPVLLAAALVARGYTKPNSARARFQNSRNQSLLGPWFDAWKTYEADNFNTD